MADRRTGADSAQNDLEAAVGFLTTTLGELYEIVVFRRELDSECAQLTRTDHDTLNNAGP